MSVNGCIQTSNGASNKAAHIYLKEQDHALNERFEVIHVVESSFVFDVHEE